MWNKHRYHASAASGSAFACHALSSSLKTPPAYAREHWAIVRYVSSHRSPVRLVANDAGRGVLGRHNDVHIFAAGCAECILVPSFKLAGRRSAYVLSKAQTWGRQFWRHVGGRAARPAHGTTHSLWADAQCVWRTRFSVAQFHLLPAGLDMLRPDGSSKTYCVY